MNDSSESKVCVIYSLNEYKYRRYVQDLPRDRARYLASYIQQSFDLEPIQEPDKEEIET